MWSRNARFLNPNIELAHKAPAPRYPKYLKNENFLYEINFLYDNFYSRSFGLSEFTE